MGRAIALIVALSSAASGVIAAVPRGPWQITELGFSAGIANTNNRGDVIGANVLWTAGGLLDLGALSGGEPVTASAINDRRQIVGWGPDVTGFSQAFLWDDGVLTNLGTLGGAESLAFDINSRGHVAGVARTAANELHGFLWAHGVMRDLGSVAFVTGVNNRDQVVGGAFTPLGELRAFIWTRGSITFLGTLPVGPTALPMTSMIVGRSSGRWPSGTAAARSCGSAE